MNGTNTVLAIAGPPGSGKTTLMLALAERLPEASWMSMDGFPAPSDMAPEALARWLDDGADFSRLETPGLEAALGAWTAGQATREPLTGRGVSPADLLLLEAPLGRAHGPTGSLIDVLVWIDTPLDVALARNLAVWTASNDPHPSEWLAGYAQHYLEVTRKVLLAQRDAVAADADLVLDGLLSPAVQAGQVIAALGLKP
jgi:uridine kinase